MKKHRNWKSIKRGLRRPFEWSGIFPGISIFKTPDEKELAQLEERGRKQAVLAE